MNILPGWGLRVRGLFADNKGPWGSSSDSGDAPPTADDNPAPGPWGEPVQGGRRPSPGASGTSLEELLRRGRMRFGGGGGGSGGTGGFPVRPDRSMIVWAILAFMAIWLIFTSFHSISPGQRGVVSRLGRYNATLGPGVSLTFPSPIDRVQKIDV